MYYITKSDDTNYQDEKTELLRGNINALVNKKEKQDENMIKGLGKTKLVSV